MSKWNETGLANLKHGEARKGNKSAEYKIWEAMKSRCLNPKAANYGRYGGAGVTICQKWSESFMEFLDEVGRRPSPKHSIDRINSHKGYEPGNCRWATRSEQMKNRRPLKRAPNGQVLPKDKNYASIPNS